MRGKTDGRQGEGRAGTGRSSTDSAALGDGTNGLLLRLLLLAPLLSLLFLFLRLLRRLARLLCRWLSHWLSLVLLDLLRLPLLGNGLCVLLHGLLLRSLPHVLQRLLSPLSLPCLPSLFLLPCLPGLFLLPRLLLLLLLLKGQRVNGLLCGPLIRWLTGSSLSSRFGKIRSLRTLYWLTLPSTRLQLPLLGWWGVRESGYAIGLAESMTGSVARA